MNEWVGGWVGGEKKDYRRTLPSFSPPSCWRSLSHYDARPLPTHPPTHSTHLEGLRTQNV